jgi:hypothetical protein
MELKKERKKEQVRSNAAKQWQRWTNRTRKHKTMQANSNPEPTTTTNLTAMVAAYLVVGGSRWMRIRQLQIRHRPKMKSEEMWKVSAAKNAKIRSVEHGTSLT